MRNLEQIRAANALKAGEKKDDYRGVKDGQVVKKVPAMIRENGLLGAIAFATEKNERGIIKNEGHYNIWRAIIDHLAKDGIKRLDNVITPEQFIQKLSGEQTSSAVLRDVTDEALAYLNYLRRFAQ